MNDNSPRKRIVALVPMRHQSERVPGKNYRLLGRKPLFHHVISALSKCEEIDRIVVDTDSPTIFEDLKTTFPEVQLLERPEHLRDGAIPMNDIIAHDISQVPATFYLQTHSTNPFLKAETISKAIDCFFENYPAYDSLFSVTALRTRLWTSAGKPLNHDPQQLLRTQDLEPVYEENSNIFIFSGADFQKNNNRIGARPYLFEMDAAEAHDIDDERDFRLAEFLINESL